jgi:antibiotic biosynthesis monooxygenase (ABM) superfamily enzyme
MVVPAERRMPTVVVSRRAADGMEREFERWLRRLAAAAKEAPGHVRSDVQPPDEVHPGEWTIVYQFQDADALEAWLTGSTRQAIIDDGRDLLVGEEREQVLALADQRDSVTAFSSFRIRPGEEERYHGLYRRLVERLSAFAGFLRSELYEPVPGVQEETVVAFAFDTAANLRAWLESEDRREILDEISEVLEHDPTLNVVGGFGGWFAQPGDAEVKRWKQASIVLLALFPTSLVLTLVRNWLLPDVGLVLGVLFANVLGVIALTWLLMPPLTGLFANWLRR